MGNPVEEIWKQLKKNFSQCKHAEVLEDTIHLWGPSGDTVAVISRTNKTIVVYDFSLMLDRFENRANKYFYKKIKDFLRKMLSEYQDPVVKVIRICGVRNLKADLSELFSA